MVVRYLEIIVLMLTCMTVTDGIQLPDEWIESTTKDINKTIVHSIVDIQYLYRPVVAMVSQFHCSNLLYKLVITIYESIHSHAFCKDS